MLDAINCSLYTRYTSYLGFQLPRRKLGTNSVYLLRPSIGDLVALNQSLPARSSTRELFMYVPFPQRPPVDIHSDSAPPVLSFCRPDCVPPLPWCIALRSVSVLVRCWGPTDYKVTPVHVMHARTSDLNKASCGDSIPSSTVYPARLALFERRKWIA